MSRGRRGILPTGWERNEELVSQNLMLASWQNVWERLGLYQSRVQRRMSEMRKTMESLEPLVQSIGALRHDVTDLRSQIHRIGHNYIGHDYRGHYYIGHNYIGHNYIGHYYIGHNYIGP